MMDKRMGGAGALSMLAMLGVSSLGSPARGGIDVDFGAAVSVGDDTDVFLAVSSRHFDRDREVVGTWFGRYERPDDCTVALFISRHSSASLSKIFGMRREGLSWWGIGVPVDVWFVPVAVDPGPPYGKAYGHWRKHHADPRHRFTLGDGEVRDLVSVRVLHDYYGIEPAVAMKIRSGGGNIRTLVAKEYRQRRELSKRRTERAPSDGHHHKTAKGKSQKHDGSAR
jgi:hypothetical protein